MKDILIWGTGSAYDKIKMVFNLDKLNILAFVDSDLKKKGLNKDGKTIIEPIEINNYSYNYVLIASSLKDEILIEIKKLNIKDEKIVFALELLESLKWTFMKKLYFEKIIKLINNDIDCIMTGLSYARWGIDEKVCSRKILNLAMDASDLYVDYLIAKKAIMSNKRIKDVFIGLSYYSFQYDLSKVKIYSKYDCKVIYKDIIEDNRQIEEDFLKDKIEDNIFNVSRDEIGNLKSRVLGEKSLLYYEEPEIEKRCKELAILDSKKNYPKTVEDNIKIIKDYIKMIRLNKCNVSIIIFPVNKRYSKHFDSRLKKEFHSIIDMLRNNFKINVYDYFDCSKMNDSDFRDPSHLNFKGATKFTKILINDGIFNQ